MNLHKTKLGRIVNFIKNDGKFKRADLVQVLKNDSNYSQYDSWVGKYAIVTDINYDKKDYIVGLKFTNGESGYFKVDELRKCDYIEEHANKEFRTLLNMI